MGTGGGVTVLAGGVSVGVLAGVVSAILYLVVAALRWASAVRSSLCCSVAPLAPLAPLAPQSVSKKALHKLATTDWIPVLEKGRQGDGGSESESPATKEGGAEDVDGDPEESVSRVRELMERLAESLVAGGIPGGLDHVALRPLHPHPAYQRVLSRHQPRLRSALTSLAYSLQMAAAHKPLSELETPGRAHAELRALVLDLARDVAALPPPPDKEMNGTRLVQENGNFGTRAYEDLLATAIVNKVMERGQRGLANGHSKKDRRSYISSLEVRLMSGDASTGSPSPSPSESLASWSSSDRVYPESEHLSENISEFVTDPLSLMIEECIEEVTTVTTSSASCSESDYSDGEFLPHLRRRRRQGRPGSRTSRSRSSLSNRSGALTGLTLIRGQKVPFPELGVDIVDVADYPDSGGSDLSDRESMSEATDEEAEPMQASCVELITPLQSWEDNWLFRSRKLKVPNQGHHPVPVPMLVPNPSEDFRALIGDVDAEETSDLSECSDDALEEVVLSGSWSPARNGVGVGADSDFLGQFDDEAVNANQEGLAETCNLELLRKAHVLPMNATIGDNPQNGYPSLERDKDSEVTVLYAAPTRRLAPSSKKNTHPTPSARRLTSTSKENLSISPNPLETEETVSPSLRPESRTNQVVKSATDSAEHTLVQTPTHPPRIVKQTAIDEPDAISEPIAISDELSPVQNPDFEPTSRHEEATVVEEEDSLATPPRPGTIADREHRKWQQAAPLANNPYSSESIQKRLQQRSLSLIRSSSLASGSQAGVVQLSEMPASPVPSSSGDAPIQIALGVEPDPRRYGRDFYINTSKSSERSLSSTKSLSTSFGELSKLPPRNSSPSTTVHTNKESSEDINLDDKSDQGVRTNGDGGHDQDALGVEDAELALPSVKELAKQFLREDEHHPSSRKSNDQIVGVLQKEISIMNDDERGLLAVPPRQVRQVHSLTARSMSREFREGLRQMSPPGQHIRHQGSSPTSAPGTAHAQNERPDPEGAGTATLCSEG